MVRATDRPTVRRAVFRALAQASKNLGLYVAPEAAEHLARAKDAAWVPLEQLLGLLELAAAPYKEQAPLLERLGAEMVDAWYQKEAHAKLSGGVRETLAQLGHAYHAIVHGDASETGDVHLTSFDEPSGELFVRSTTPFSRDFERGVLRAVLLKLEDVVGVETERGRAPGQHRVRVWTKSAMAAAADDDETPTVLTGADEVRRLAHVGGHRAVEGAELFLLVERGRETQRELRRAQALLRSTTSALDQALSDRASQHRVLAKLVREHRIKSKELSDAEASLERARERLGEVAPRALRLIDELCERLPGSRLSGRYEVVRRLGHGVASNVYDVLDHKRGDHAALRVLRAPTPELVPEIERQAERLEQARLPRVPAVRSVTTLAGVVPCVVTDAVHGRSLRRILLEHGRLDEDAASTIAQGLLEVLRSAHEAGLSHGSVRPESVMVRGEGASLLELELAPVSAALPRSASSAAYRAPEAQGGPASPAGDVFATGAILLEALTGDPPEHGVARRVPASRVGALCVTALDPSPGSRPRAGELYDALASLSSPVSLHALVERHRPSAAPAKLESGVYPSPEATERRAAPGLHKRPGSG